MPVFSFVFREMTQPAEPTGKRGTTMSYEAIAAQATGVARGKIAQTASPRDRPMRSRGDLARVKPGALKPAS
jgi:hypothetical protein